jgi:hypothetical protein
MNKLPSITADPPQPPDPRFYELASYLLRGHSVRHYHWVRDHVAIAMWMAAANTLDDMFEK